jgi:alpha-tubulin suppressor-like RCC1 family protein
MRPALSTAGTLALLVMGCGSSDLAAPGQSLTPATLIVSDAAPTADDPTTHAYASLPSGSVPRGLQATVRNRANGAEASAPMVDGAVDPVQLPGATGDIIELTAVDSSGAEFEFMGAIKPKVPPVVVRSSPGMRATDAPSLLRIGVVFSEPVSEPTVNENTVTIILRDQPVPGRVELSKDGLLAEFVPEDSLVPGYTYTLLVSRGVQDRSGDALAQEYRIEFTVMSASGVRIEFASVSAGNWYTCAVSVEREVYCWGRGKKGQLGHGGLEDRHWPTRVALPFRAVSLEAGQQTTCAVTNVSLLFCWGNPYTSSRSPYRGDSLITRPTAVLGGRDLPRAAVGSGRMCGVDRANFLWCLGGRSTLRGSTFWVEPDPGLWLADPDMAQLSLGPYHDCYIDRTGAAYCEGGNFFGQIGNGTASDSDSTEWSPVPVTGGLAFSHVSTGSYHTCGLADARAYCWGYNVEGQLGIDRSDDWRTEPVPLAGDLRFSTIDAGERHTCGITADEAAYCWGDNRVGQLGDGSRTQRRAAAAVAGGLRFRSISAGFDHTCAVSAEGAIYCWGENADGQLGDGSTSDALGPVRVADRR